MRMGTFYVCLLAAATVFSLGAFIFGHDTDHGLDHGLDHGDAMPSLFSMRVISLFVLGFSGVSTIAHYVWQFAPVYSSLCGLGGGVILGGFAYALVYVFSKEQASSLVSSEDYVGQPARVSVAIPAEGTGEVAATIKDQLRSVFAVSADGSAIPEGRAVTIVSMAAGTATVKPVL
jgi:hypothetical protein